MRASSADPASWASSPTKPAVGSRPFKLQPHCPTSAPGPEPAPCLPIHVGGLSVCRWAPQAAGRRRRLLQQCDVGVERSKYVPSGTTVGVAGLEPSSRMPRCPVQIPSHDPRITTVRRVSTRRAPVPIDTRFAANGGAIPALLVSTSRPSAASRADRSSMTLGVLLSGFRRWPRNLTGLE